ncbi:hypothetical protein [Pontibacter sp. SGAir0037]|uniref:hypothetical protein n=1 Tax=Pontibacter sp. SGAir0037 TaxID=2571030 RepID=UPI0010F6A42B|nr:hypothetical protein [Pontibacter sp. SGAir0037]
MEGVGGGLLVLVRSFSSDVVSGDCAVDKVLHLRQHLALAGAVALVAPASMAASHWVHVLK